MKIGLTDGDIERLEDGESVEFVVPGLEKPGYNTTVTIEPADLDEIGQYENLCDLWDAQADDTGGGRR